MLDCNFDSHTTHTGIFRTQFVLAYTWVLNNNWYIHNLNCFNERIKNSEHLYKPYKVRAKTVTIRLNVLLHISQRPWQMRITYLLWLIHCLIILRWNERFGLTTYRSKLRDRRGPVTDINKYEILINWRRILFRYQKSMKVWDFRMCLYFINGCICCEDIFSVMDYFFIVECVLRKICRTYRSKSLIKHNVLC